MPLGAQTPDSFLLALDLEYDRNFDPHTHEIDRLPDDAAGGLYIRVSSDNVKKAPVSLARQKMEVVNGMIKLGLNVEDSAVFDEGYGVVPTGEQPTPALGSLCRFIHHGRLDGGHLTITKTDRISQYQHQLTLSLS